MGIKGRDYGRVTDPRHKRFQLELDYDSKRAMGLTLKASDSPSPQPFSFGGPSPSADSQGDSPTPAAAGSPPAPFLTAKDMKLYGSVPLNQEIGIVRCADCDKPVLMSAIAEHDGEFRSFFLALRDEG